VARQGPFAPGDPRETSCSRHATFSGTCRACLDAALASATRHTLEELEEKLAEPGTVLELPQELMPYFFAPRVATAHARLRRRIDKMMAASVAAIQIPPSPRIPAPRLPSIRVGVVPFGEFGGAKPVPHNGEIHVGVVLGWRAWKVGTIGGHQLLMSVGMKDAWLPRVPMVALDHTYGGAASCWYREPHKVPSFENDRDQCGIWALRDLHHAVLVTLRYEGIDYNGPVYAFGIAALWGRIVEHEKGWRAQLAYPQAVVLTRGDTRADPARRWKIADELSELYRIPVAVASSPNPIEDFRRVLHFTPRPPLQDELLDFLGR
jgi:hypothetical protein